MTTARNKTKDSTVTLLGNQSGRGTTGRADAQTRARAQARKNQQAKQETQGRDDRGAVEKFADENLTAGTAASLGIPALVGAKTSVPFLSRGAAFLGMPKLAAFTGGYTVGNALDNQFDFSGKIADLYGKITGGTDRGAMTDKERDLIAKGFNPTKPIYGGRGKITGYEKFNNPVVDEPVASAAAPTTEAPAVAPTPELPAVPAAPAVPAVPAAPATVAQAPIPEQASVPFQTPKTEAEALAPRGPGFTDQQMAAPGTALGAYTLPPLEEGGDPRIMGIVRAPTAENPMATQTQEISMEDLNRLEAQQAEQGTPFISGEPAPGLKPFIDASGNVAFADANTAERMNALEGQRRQEDAAAQQKFLQSDAAKEMSNRQLQRVQQGGSFAQASRDREARLAAKPDFNEVQRGKSSVGKDGLTDAQRRKAYPDPAMRAQSKAGLLGNIVEQKQLELDALRTAEKEDPTKAQEIMEAVDSYMGMMGPMTTKEKNDLRRQLFYEFYQGTQFDPIGGEKALAPGLPVEETKVEV